MNQTFIYKYMYMYIYNPLHLVSSSFIYLIDKDIVISVSVNIYLIQLPREN